MEAIEISDLTRSDGDFEFKEVRNIDWTDSFIKRAGVIPIFDNGRHKFIGLAVSNFSGNISPIGGAYENVDHDLLSTAVREYNEEVGENMQNITHDSVYNCIAIKSAYTIQIFLPVKEYNTKFIPTEEVNNLIWVTPDQLRIMGNNQDYSITMRKNNRVKPFFFSLPFINIINAVADAVASGVPFKRVNLTDPFFRPPRNKIMDSVFDIRDEEQFISDAKSNPVWHVTAMAIGKKYAGLMRGDKIIYIFSIDKLVELIPYINSVKHKIFFATDNDKNNAIRNLGIDTNIISNMEHGYRWIIGRTSETNHKELTSMSNNFFLDLDKIRKSKEPDRVIEECKLILNYESKLYKFINLTNAMFNEPRACFLDAINIINRYLTLFKIPHRYLDTKTYLSSELKCQHLSAVFILNELIKKKIYFQDENSTVLFLDNTNT